jgi:hypothetical protein
MGPVLSCNCAKLRAAATGRTGAPFLFAPTAVSDSLEDRLRRNLDRVATH